MPEANLFGSRYYGQEEFQAARRRLNKNLTAIIKLIR